MISPLDSSHAACKTIPTPNSISSPSHPPSLPAHPVVEVDIADQHGVGGHPGIGGKRRDALAEGDQLALPAGIVKSAPMMQRRALGSL